MGTKCLMRFLSQKYIENIKKKLGKILEVIKG